MDDLGMNAVRIFLEAHLNPAVCCMCVFFVCSCDLGHCCYVDRAWYEAGNIISMRLHLVNKIGIRTKFFTFRSPPSPFRTRCRAVLQKPIWIFLSPENSGRLVPVPFDFSMIFGDGHFWPRRILRFPPSEPLRGSSSGDFRRRIASKSYQKDALVL